MPEIEREVRTPEQIAATIKAARDSVWVVNEQLAKLANGETMNNEIEGNIKRNVDHLKLVVSAEDIVGIDEDLSDLHQAIAAGEAALPQQ